MCAVFFDLKKAFDSVPHRNLIDKLESLGLNRYIVEWTQSYLTNRQQHVLVGGESSNSLPVLSGVPQGSVLGPLLFLIYIDEVPALHFTTDSSINLYADDMLLYKAISNESDYQSLQQDIDKLQVWVDNARLSLNPGKCKCMVISRKRAISSVTLTLGESTLEQVNTFKYLGIILSSNLSWTHHIEHIAAKAKKLIGLLYRQFYNSVSPEVLLRIYTATVRPHLEYGAQVWDPHLVKDSVRLENVQKLALKICTKNWDLSYNALLNITGIPALKDRRQYLKLCTFFSIVNSMFFFNYSIPQVSSHRYSHNTLPLYQEPRAHQCLPFFIYSKDNSSLEQPACRCTSIMFLATI